MWVKNNTKTCKILNIYNQDNEALQTFTNCMNTKKETCKSSRHFRRGMKGIKVIHKIEYLECDSNIDEYKKELGTKSKVKYRKLNL
jgi:hypothetical protein